jgi:hypothetical protein
VETLAGFCALKAACWELAAIQNVRFGKLVDRGVGVGLIRYPLICASWLAGKVG